MNRRLFLALLPFAASLIGCGTSTNPALSNPQQVVRLGVLAPLDGGLVEFGRGIRNSVQLAVNQANASGQFAGVRFEVAARDDSSDPQVGVVSAQSLANDPLVVGVVGTYNSGVASAVLPIFQDASLLMISPGNTDPTLTRGTNPSNPVRPHFNYFRLVVPDSVQGEVLARHSFQVLGVRNVALVSEDKPVSLGLVDAYADAFTALGGNITIREVAAEGTVNYTTIIGNVSATNPELVVYGGEFATAAVFRQQSVTQGLTVPLMGSDGIKDPAYITGAGPGSEGDFASSVGAPAANLPGGPQFLLDYQAAGFAEPPSDFGPYAYDAANLIMAAVARRGAVRPALIEEVGASEATGVTGRLAFDLFGDTLNKVLTIYQVDNGAFVPATTVTIP